jgi:hypothetical protein
MSILSLVSAGLAAAVIFPIPVYSSPGSPIVPNEQRNPMQVRLAYAGDAGMMVSWNTFSELDLPFVRYGRRPNDLNKIAFSNISVTYPTSTTYSNHVKITSLEPDTLYYYLPFGSNSSVPYTFRTSRRAGDETPYSIAVAVDMGLIGKDGLSTHVGNGAANPLAPGDNTTQQSLQVQGANTDFLWHRMYFRNSSIREERRHAN